MMVRHLNNAEQRSMANVISRDGPLHEGMERILWMKLRKLTADT